MCAILPACSATTTGFGATSEFCLLYEPIHWSRRDTPETVLQIKVNNAKYLALCVDKIMPSKTAGAASN